MQVPTVVFKYAYFLDQDPLNATPLHCDYSDWLRRGQNQGPVITTLSLSTYPHEPSGKSPRLSYIMATATRQRFPLHLRTGTVTE
eukprot:6488173-Amphidinium_carterae.3